jgi:hypothetical protein
VLPFLHILQSVAAGATAEAAASQAAFKQQTQQYLAAAQAAGLFERAEEDSELEEDAAATDDGSGSAPGDSAAARYFKQRIQRQAAEADGTAAEAATATSDEKHQPGKQPDHSSNNSTAGAAATRKAADATSAAAAVNLESLPPLPDHLKLQLSALQLEQLDLQWRRAYSAASLASSAAETATPLLLQRSLRAAVLATSVLSSALEVLAAASDALDGEERLFEKLLAREPDAAMKPARPAPVKLLPAVHSAWPLLLAALQDTRSVALLEQGLALMCSMMQLAGGRFMARRFKQEAWPLLMRLAKQGPQGGASALAAAAAASTTGGAASAAVLLGVGQGPGSEKQGIGSNSSSSSSVLQTALRSLEAAASSSSNWNEVQQGLALESSSSQLQEDDSLAPATLQRVQVAVLACLQGICSSSAAAPAMQGPLLWDACMLAAPYLAGSQALPLREVAAKLLLAAAQVDADAVWLVLFDLGSCYQDLEQLVTLSSSAAAAAAADAGAAAESAAVSSSNLQEQAAGEGCTTSATAGKACDKVVVQPLPKLQQLLPHASAKQAAGDSSSLQRLLCSSEGASCGKRAVALLPRVAQLPVAWHAKAEQQLLQLRSAHAL